MSVLQVATDVTICNSACLKLAGPPTNGTLIWMAQRQVLTLECGTACQHHSHVGSLQSALSRMHRIVAEQTHVSSVQNVMYSRNLERLWVVVPATECRTCCVYGRSLSHGTCRHLPNNCNICIEFHNISQHTQLQTCKWCGSVLLVESCICGAYCSRVPGYNAH